MRAAAFVLAISAVAGAASAQVRWSGEAGAATDYVKRGVSRSDGRAQAYASATVASGTLYAGGFASTVKLGNADGEVDLYIGWSPEAFGYLFDLSAAQNVYVGDDRLSYTDVQLQASRKIGPIQVAALVGGSPDYLGGDQAWWAQGEASVELRRRWTLSATLGQEDTGALDHVYWSVGSAWKVDERLGVELRYWGTDGKGDRLDDRLMFGVKATF